MRPYKPKKLRPFLITAMLLRGLGNLVAIWPLLLIAAFILSPVGPHLRVQSTYANYGAYRNLIACDYIGSRGLVRVRSDCPLVKIIDRRVAGGP